jgi:Trm5-related predicted tRNA methylase
MENKIRLTFDTADVMDNAIRRYIWDREIDLTSEETDFFMKKINLVNKKFFKNGDYLTVEFDLETWRRSIDSC